MSKQGFATWPPRITSKVTSFDAGNSWRDNHVMSTIPDATGVVSSVLVGLITGIAASAFVAWFFYWLGRSDMTIERWISQIDSVLVKLTYLDPRRRESIRPGDGVDDTSHAIRCIGAVMRFSGFEEGQKLAESIADEMVKWFESSEPKSHDDGQRMKARWSSQLEHEITNLRKRSCWRKWWARGSKSR